MKRLNSRLVILLILLTAGIVAAVVLFPREQPRNTAHSPTPEMMQQMFEQQNKAMKRDLEYMNYNDKR